MEAVGKLVKHNFTGLPVVDSQGHVIGIISEKDMLALAIREQDIPAVPSQTSLRVEDLMTKDVVTVEATESFTTLCACLMKNKFRRIPIVLNNKLVGIVSRKDIITDILAIG